MVSTLDCVVEHHDTGFLVNFVNGVVNPFGVFHFEALVGWVVLEKGFQWSSGRSSDP